MKKSLIATLAAGGSLAVAGLTGGLVADAAPAYPLPPTTTVAQQPPPNPPTNVTLPQTGSDGVQNTVMMGGTLAVAGLGLILVTRRRRQHTAVS